MDLMGICLRDMVWNWVADGPDGDLNSHRYIWGLPVGYNIDVVGYI